MSSQDEAPFSDAPEDWQSANNALLRTFEFESAADAIAFVMRVGLAAEEQNHHPDLRWVYRTVELRLTTHDAGDRITEKDVALARSVNAILKPRG